MSSVCVYVCMWRTWCDGQLYLYESDTASVSRCMFYWVLYYKPVNEHKSMTRKWSYTLTRTFPLRYTNQDLPFKVHSVRSPLVLQMLCTLMRPSELFSNTDSSVPVERTVIIWATRDFPANYVPAIFVPANQLQRGWLGLGLTVLILLCLTAVNQTPAGGKQTEVQTGTEGFAVSHMYSFYFEYCSFKG